jgi:hypothetical protein
MEFKIVCISMLRYLSFLISNLKFNTCYMLNDTVFTYRVLKALEKRTWQKPMQASDRSASDSIVLIFIAHKHDTCVTICSPWSPQVGQWCSSLVWRP